ncbi:MAG: hypothetical protein Q8L48_20905 [Archangium sp.]|nr:hypothetical protein [Archangium sp.]
MKKQVKIPLTVLARAKAAVEKKPQPPPQQPPRKAKVIAALKKLHPMD